jgi:YggT family protein
VITGLLHLLVSFYSYIVLAAVIVSWVAPDAQHPLLRWLRAVTEPVFDKVRSVVPAVGGFDLSPMVVLLGLQLLQRVI